MNSALCHSGHKISPTLSKLIGDGGGRDSISAFYSVKLCVMINFSFRHNVLCFSFVVVSKYFMYSLYAIIIYLMKEVVMCNKILRLKSLLKVDRP